MTDHRPSASDSTGDSSRIDRRCVLGAIATTGATLATSGVAGARRAGRGPAAGTGPHGVYPPAGITEFGDPVSLGNGRVWTYTTVSNESSLGRVAHGLYLERDALAGLPSAEDLANAGSDEYADKYGSEGETLEIHHKWSQEFFVPFPATDATPVTFLGLNWNPGGHPPPGVWTVPHFDIHFHLQSMATVDAITGPAAPTYDLPARYVPEGYARGPVVDERVITDMGEHLVDPTVPEMNGGEFSNTLIWGVADPDGDGTAEQTFVEPMLTREYLRTHEGVDRRPVAQPATYARAGRYPTAYEVRDLPGQDAIAVEIDSFEAVAGEN